MKETLKKIANKIKQTGKRVIVAGLTLAMLYTPAQAGKITIYQDTDSPLTHAAETTIACNDNNSPFLAWTAPAIDGYLLDGPTKLSKQSKDSKDFSDFYGQLQTTGIDVGQPAWWKAVIDNSDRTLDNKNVTVKIYDKNANVNDPNSSTVTTFDPFCESINNPQYYGWFQSGSFAPQTQGVYGQIVYDVSNKADLNRDGKVNGRDYAIFANNWQRTGIVKGSNPNDANDYADLMDTYDETGTLIKYGDGTVNADDLMIFTEEYLWDSNDSNSWSKDANPVIPQKSDFYEQQRQKFFAEYGPKNNDKRLEGKLERKAA